MAPRGSEHRLNIEVDDRGAPAPERPDYLRVRMRAAIVGVERLLPRIARFVDNQDHVEVADSARRGCDPCTQSSRARSTGGPAA